MGRHLRWCLFLPLVWFVLAILGSAVAGERFTDNGDGTVTDHQLGLMWAKSDNQGDIDWKEAGQWIRFTFPYTITATYDNWRMPTLEELSSLYTGNDKKEGYETACGQWVQIVPYIRLSCGWVWSAETSAIQAHIFNFHRGTRYTDRMAHKRGYRALPVRDLE